MISANQALERLRDGNARYVGSQCTAADHITPQRRAELARGQEPFAVILGCADSRVPAEIVFDQGLGDLFTIRVAGNIASPPEVGSVEFAATKCGTPLVVVLGHTQCGAIHATLDAIEHPDQPLSPGLASIVNHVRPAIDKLGSPDRKLDHQTRVRHAVRANVRATANHLRHGSAILESLIESGALLVVGAEYDLASGEIEFFDGVPGA